MIVLDCVKFNALEQPVPLRAQLCEAVNVHVGQKVYVHVHEKQRLILVTGIPLNIHLMLQTITLADKPGSLAHATQILAKAGVNLLRADIVRIGDVAICETIADWSPVKSDDKLMEKLKAQREYVVAATPPLPIAMLSNLPEINQKPVLETQIIRLDSVTYGLDLSKSPFIKRIIDWSDGESYVIASAYTRIPLISLQLFRPTDTLVKLVATIKDIPGSLAGAAKAIEPYVDLKAFTQTVIEYGESCLWSAYGLLSSQGSEESIRKALAPNCLQIVTFELMRAAEQ